MQKRLISPDNRLYIGYRKIRFLARTGSLFTLSKAGLTGKVEIPKGTFNVISLNSCMLFLIAYLVVNLLNLFIVGYTAIIFDIPVKIFYYDVDFLIRGVEWTPDSVSGVFSSGPIAMFVLSLLMIILYKNVETETGILRLLLLWMIFHMLTRFFGEILVGAILSKGFGYVLMYLFVMDTGKVILTIAGFVAMFTIGLIITRLSLHSANIYFNDLLGRYRIRFILSQFFIPYFVGNLVIFILKLPKVTAFEIAINLSMILFLIPILGRSFSMEDAYFDEEPRTIKYNLILPVITVVMLLSFRIIFGIGVRL
ncbi:MAG: hypothetical protein WCJ26_00945 [bacterium]